MAIATGSWHSHLKTDGTAERLEKALEVYEAHRRDAVPTYILPADPDQPPWIILGSGHQDNNLIMETWFLSAHHRAHAGAV